MTNNILQFGAVLISLMAPMGANAQGVAAGARVGGVAGGVGGLLGIDQRPRYREYVVHEHPPSYRYSEDVRAGAILPPDGVQYYEVPPEYGVTTYRYAIVNDRTVVDPNTHRIVQIID
jgi:hypothetical protein